jgi:hypothetical protein
MLRSMPSHRSFGAFGGYDFDFGGVFAAQKLMRIGWGRPLPQSPVEVVARASRSIRTGKPRLSVASVSRLMGYCFMTLPLGSETRLIGQYIESVGSNSLPKQY